MSACLQSMTPTLGRQQKPILHWFDVAGRLFREQQFPIMRILLKDPINNQMQSNHLTKAQNGRKGTLCSIQLSFTVQGSSRPIQTVTNSPPTFLVQALGETLIHCLTSSLGQLGLPWPTPRRQSRSRRRCCSSLKGWLAHSCHLEAPLEARWDFCQLCLCDIERTSAG